MNRHFHRSWPSAGGSYHCTDAAGGRISELGLVRASHISSMINTGYDESGPAISRDGLTLYFQSNRPGGVGTNNCDIWIADARAFTMNGIGPRISAWLSTARGVRARQRSLAMNITCSLPG